MPQFHMNATQPEAVGEVVPLQCDVVQHGQSSPHDEDCVPAPPLELVGAPAVSHGSSEAAAFKAATIVVEATLHFETCAKEFVTQSVFSEVIQTVFLIGFGMKFSTISGGSVEVTSATAIRISFSAPGCDLLTAKTSSWAGKMAADFQEWLAHRNFGCTISLMDGVTAVLQGRPDSGTLTAETIDVEATMHLGSPCAKDSMALDSFSVLIQEVFARIFSINISMSKSAQCKPRLWQRFMLTWW